MKKIEKKMSGEMTLEVAIVMPFVMLVILLVIYISFYLHDINIIKSYGYCAAIENRDKNPAEFEKCIKQNIKKAPLMITTCNVFCGNRTGLYTVTFKTKHKSAIKWVNAILNKGQNEYYIEVEKTISKEIMYAGRAICDELKEEKKKE